MVRANRDGSGGAGKGAARRTACSTERWNMVSPVHWVTSTLTTSPPGIWSTVTLQVWPRLALGGRSQLRSTFCRMLSL